MKMKWNNTQALVAVICLSISSLANAKDYSVSFKFDKRPPKVALIYIPAETGDKTNAEVDQLNKQFTTKMVVASPGSAVSFKNSDTVDHNIFASDASVGAQFDVGLMAPGGERDVDIDWSEDSIVRVGCKIHPKMRTYIAAVKSRYEKVVEFSPAEKEFSVTLGNLPADANKIVIRIPKYDTIEIDISAATNNTLHPVTKRGKDRGGVTLVES